MIEFQKLLDLIKTNGCASHFRLNCFINSCGTFGCLIGNDFLANRGERPCLRSAIKDIGPDLGGAVWNWRIIATEYGITLSESLFLFSDIKHTLCWVKDHNEGFAVYRDFLDKKAAINRVRKFIYYKLHKRELMEDPQTRHSEGDFNVVQRTVEKVSALAASAL